ncbi:FprA family A-type flavoprotein [Peptoniphilus senegalensis]|uniref:FprA family A-type flavoprotein n=1 Tax=Peptoniphilus senegalensis TaxID=1465757 RepID=A0ABV1IYT4_9FIRM|nr:FprA family A-type flavoprotein [Peptoniphilus senegalensis]CAG7592576.1 Anaerobic nitric oxide reductase flavorubredoxin [Peptoniphilus tyrrelliae]
MLNNRKITDDLYFVGGNDKRLELFENMFPIPDGVSYNSYLLMDEKTVLVDSVDWSIAREYIQSIENILDGRSLDYMLIHHMEPDHCGAIEEICIRWPDIRIISSEQGFQFMRQMGYHIPENQLIIVEEGDTISFGKHTLAFIEAPMVHWPEVIMSLDVTDGVLFSADGFGSFKSMDGKLFADEVDWERDWLDEARRYLTNIVGKYGPFVQDVLKKAAPLLPQVKYICPLHGLVWRDNFGFILDKYDKWSRYEPEEEGVLIVYASMYGNTERAAQDFANSLVERGVKKVEVYDVSKTDISYLIAKTFQYSHLVIASVTYNLGIYPKMKNFLHDLEALNVQNRTVGIIENGTWACTVGDKIENYIDENLKLFDVLPERVTINTSLNEANENDMEALADSIIESMAKIREVKEKSAN